jgi:hypothetical protein
MAASKGSRHDVRQIEHKTSAPSLAEWVVGYANRTTAGRIGIRTPVFREALSCKSETGRWEALLISVQTLF